MRFGFGKSSVQIVSDYVASINARDIAQVEALLADDARLVDSGGQEVAGHQSCIDLIKRAWACIPDYQLHIESMHARGNEVLLRGHVEGGPMHGNPSQFRAVVEDRRVTSWETFSAHTVSVIDWINAEAERSDNQCGSLSA